MGRTLHELAGQSLDAMPRDQRDAAVTLHALGMPLLDAMVEAEDLLKEMR